jgi:hypothetical protein
MRLLNRLGLGDGTAELVVLAGETGPRLGPQRPDDLASLLQPVRTITGGAKLQGRIPAIVATGG